jgi:predicted nucleic acid-binding protein
MKAVVVDTNIIFAALRKNQSAIRRQLEQGNFHFYAPHFLIVEIFKHKKRILHMSKALPEETYELLTNLLHHVHFVNESFISTEDMITAFRLCKDVDEKDTPFVALTMALDGELWTRDEALKQALTRKGFTRFH